MAAERYILILISLFIPSPSRPSASSCSSRIFSFLNSAWYLARSQVPCISSTRQPASNKGINKALGLNVICFPVAQRNDVFTNDIINNGPVRTTVSKIAVLPYFE